MKRAKTPGVQYAALPWRIVGRQVQILLITSRRTRRWVIPKGWPMRGLKPQHAAAIEASEEAGLVGQIDERPFGAYHYLKEFKRSPSVDLEVQVFPFRVTYQAAGWKEQGQRAFEWRPYREAARMVAEPTLKRLILDFGAARTPSLLGRFLRTPHAWRLGRAAHLSAPHARLLPR